MARGPLLGSPALQGRPGANFASTGGCIGNCRPFRVQSGPSAANSLMRSDSPAREANQRVAASFTESRLRLMVYIVSDGPFR